MCTLANKHYPFYPIYEITNLKQLIYDVPTVHDDIAFQFQQTKNHMISITYRQFIHHIEALGTYMFYHFQKGMHIAVIGENSYEWILTYFSAVLSGNIIVPIDKDLTEEDIYHVLNSSDTDILIYSSAYEDIAERVQQKNMPIELISMASFQKLMKEGDAFLNADKRDFIDYRVEEDDTAAIVFTSGTLAASKGVMLTHKNIATNATAACKNVHIYGTTICVLPLHHTFSFTLGICAILLYRATIFINKSLKNLQKDIRNIKPTFILLVPLIVETLYQRIWQQAEALGKDKQLMKLIKLSNLLLKVKIDIRKQLFSSIHKSLGGNLNLICSGGAMLDYKYIQGFQEFGITVINGYGITECSPMISSNRLHHIVKDSVGTVVYGCKVCIDHPDENGEGEILVQGTGVMKGYYCNQMETEQAFIDDWYKTGDIGRYEKDILYITGRKKNVIICSNGKNVFPEELEMKLMRISGIHECIVYERDHHITAEIYADKDSNKHKIIEDIHSLNQLLPIYKQILNITFRNNEFEKTTTKKIKRRSL